MSRTLRTSLAAVGTLAALGAVAACGSNNSTGSSVAGSSTTAAAASSSSAPKGTLVIGSANFPESELLADMYGDVLKADGYTVTLKPNIGSREVYYKALTSGEVDIVPEYVGTLTEYINVLVNGAEKAAATPLASTDPAATLAALKTIADGQGIVPSSTSPAQDENAFAVTKDFATKNNLTKLSDLVALNGTIQLGGPAECPTRPFCEVGLMSKYGLTFKGFTPLDAGGPLTYAGLTGGQIQLGLVFSSDGGISANNLVVLADDMNLQQSDNLIAAVAKSKSTPAIQADLDKVNAALTTEKLQGLNKQISVDKADAADVASQFLKDAAVIK